MGSPSAIQAPQSDLIRSDAARIAPSAEPLPHLYSANTENIMFRPLVKPAQRLLTMASLFGRADGFNAPLALADGIVSFVFDHSRSIEG